jgi:hypothetical protein
MLRIRIQRGAPDTQPKETQPPIPPSTPPMVGVDDLPEPFAEYMHRLNERVERARRETLRLRAQRIEEARQLQNTHRPTYIHAWDADRFGGGYGG